MCYISYINFFLLNVLITYRHIKFLVSRDRLDLLHLWVNTSVVHATVFELRQMETLKCASLEMRRFLSGKKSHTMCNIRHHHRQWVARCCNILDIRLPYPNMDLRERVNLSDRPNHCHFISFTVFPAILSVPLLSLLT